MLTAIQEEIKLLKRAITQLQNRHDNLRKENKKLKEQLDDAIERIDILEKDE